MPNIFTLINLSILENQCSFLIKKFWSADQKIGLIFLFYSLERLVNHMNSNEIVHSTSWFSFKFLFLLRIIFIEKRWTFRQLEGSRYLSMILNEILLGSYQLLRNLHVWMIWKVYEVLFEILFQKWEGNNSVKSITNNIMNSTNIDDAYRSVFEDLYNIIANRIDPGIWNDVDIVSYLYGPRHTPNPFSLRTQALI